MNSYNMIKGAALSFVLSLASCGLGFGLESHHPIAFPAKIGFFAFLIVGFLCLIFASSKEEEAND